MNEQMASSIPQSVVSYDPVQAYVCDCGKEMIEATIGVNHISVTVHRKAHMFPYVACTIEKAIVAMQRKGGHILPSTNIVSLVKDFESLYEALAAVDVKELHMDNGMVIMQYFRDTASPIVDEKKQLIICSPASQYWWKRDEVLSPIIDKIQESIPSFQPWRQDDFMMSLLRSYPKPKVVKDK